VLNAVAATAFPIVAWSVSGAPFWCFLHLFILAGIAWGIAVVAALTRRKDALTPKRGANVTDTSIRAGPDSP